MKNKLVDRIIAETERIEPNRDFANSVLTEFVTKVLQAAKFTEIKGQNGQTVTNKNKLRKFNREASYNIFNFLTDIFMLKNNIFLLILFALAIGVFSFAIIKRQEKIKLERTEKSVPAQSTQTQSVVVNDKETELTNSSIDSFSQDIEDSLANIDQLSKEYNELITNLSINGDVTDLDNLINEINSL